MCAMGPKLLVNPGALCATAGHVVDLEGFEPSTSSVRLRRAPAALQAPIFQGVRNFTVEGYKGQDGKIRLKIMEKQASKWIYCCLSAIQDS